ncbi:unnamed protein product [Phytophthora fragariaefolia]|uniref:Unnamed protein product n=1 Tax=Phytophthora fragariaefolia TaxID=1490495 RepID=A0A9W7CWJ0_9STRA|nr:unnamed protein product [Phytophthora fragariaefolia]
MRDDERDDFRRQTNITISSLAPTIATIHDMIANLVNVNDAWHVSANGWHALKSLPGGTDQAVHCDFPSFETVRALITQELVQASAIIALTGDTYLHVYPGCSARQVEHSRRRTIKLKCGHMVLFRGDLAHSGAVFSSLNVRLHCYVLLNGILQEPDLTEAVVFRSLLLRKYSYSILNEFLTTDYNGDNDDTGDSKNGDNGKNGDNINSGDSSDNVTAVTAVTTGTVVTAVPAVTMVTVNQR